MNREKVVLIFLFLMVERAVYRSRKVRESTHAGLHGHIVISRTQEELTGGF